MSARAHSNQWFATLAQAQLEWVQKATGAGEEFAGRMREYDRTATFPREDFDYLEERGFLTLAVPETFGGESGPSGNCALTVYLVVRELAKYVPSTAWCLMIHYHQCGVLARLGDDEQRKRIFADVVERGALMGSLGSETNPEQLKASANTATKLVFDAEFSPVDGGFNANGRKFFCSNAPAADYLTYWAVAPGAKGNSDGLVNCIVPRTSEGLTLTPGGWDECIGLRSTVSWAAQLENVFIPWENVLGEPGDFVQEDPYTYELSQAAHLIGSAEGAYGFILRVLQERPYLCEDDSIVVKAASLGAQLDGVLAHFFHANRLWEDGQWSEAAMASLDVLHNAKAAALGIVSEGFGIIGTRSLFAMYPFELFARDIRTAALHTRESQLLRLSLEGRMAGELFPKQKYGERLTERRSWAELGFSRNGSGRPTEASRATGD